VGNFPAVFSYADIGRKKAAELNLPLPSVEKRCFA
jgi:hypothetical protein